MLSVIILVAAGWSGNPPANCADQTQAGLSACTAMERDAAERALNATYRALMSKLAPADQARLREAERSWMDWREKECLMRTGGGAAAGGSIAPMLASECGRDLARERTVLLQALIVCGPGDLSCPAQ